MIIIFPPFLNLVTLNHENADHRHLALMTIVDEFIDPLDNDDVAHPSDVADVQSDRGNACTHGRDSGADRFTANNRVSHHGMQNAVLSEQVANALPVARIPGVDHILDNFNLWVGRHRFLLRFLCIWRLRRGAYRAPHQHNSGGDLFKPMRHLFALCVWDFLNQLNLHKRTILLTFESNRRLCQADANELEVAIMVAYHPCPPPLNLP